MANSKQYSTNKEVCPLTVSEPSSPWGGAWTEEKLNAFEKYVNAYLTIMNKHRSQYDWKLIYFVKYATEEPLVLYNTRNTPIFHFACASNNPTAIKIAKDIIK